MRYTVDGAPFRSTLSHEEGATVSGRYGDSVRGKLAGLWASRHQLVGVWVEGTNSGWLRFDFEDDTFAGEYGHFGGGEPLGSWSGELM